MVNFVLKTSKFNGISFVTSKACPLEAAHVAMDIRNITHMEVNTVFNVT
jgi:hypothetical protein